ncbi:MAG: hypothetical protein QXK88_00115 [Desulfurococcaceae archaeon]
MLDIRIILAASIFIFIFGLVVPSYLLMRRRVMSLVRVVTSDLEKKLKPVEKKYKVLYVGGYYAKYTLGSGDKIDILLSIIPRYAAIQYLIAKILRRVDKVEIFVKNVKRYVARELHVALGSDKITYMVLQEILGDKANKLSKREVEVNGKKYIVFCEDPQDVDSVRKLLDYGEKVNVKLYRVSAFKDKDLVEIDAGITPKSISEVVDLLTLFNKQVTRERLPES